MGTMDDVEELLDSLLQDLSISKNVREILQEIRDEFGDDKNIALKINAALQKVEDLSLDPNISPYVRTQIWNLTTLLETAQNSG